MQVEGDRVTDSKKESSATSSAFVQTAADPFAKRPYSASVEAVVHRLGIENQVQSWEIVKRLLNAHPEYAGRRAHSLKNEGGPSTGQVRAVKDWIESIQQLRVPGTEAETFHGRIFIIGLSIVDPELGSFLENFGFLTALKNELRESLDDVFAITSTSATLPADSAPPCLDNPAIEDWLSRRGFARALAVRINRIWNEFNSSGLKGSFALHLHGPWGAGKTSLLNLLRQELQPNFPSTTQAEVKTVSSPTRSLSRWIVIDFNAWQHQRLDPPWWFLMDAIYRQSRAQLRQNFDDRIGSFRIWLSETVWRLRTGRRDIITTTALLMLTAVAIYVVMRALGISQVSNEAGTLAKTGSDFIALISAIISLGLLAGRSLASGSALAAQAYMRSAVDPMERVAKRFHDLVISIRHPIIIFVDDLDRCQPSYVVQLLEGIQTLFYDPRVVYLVAADRRWVYCCFEKTYEQFNKSVYEPGRRLGELFLEKVFELSVSVPPISSDLQKLYWRRLLDGRTSLGRESEDARVIADQEFSNVTSEQEILSKLYSKDSDAIKQQARREAAVERLTNVRVETSTLLFLEPFASLLESNPRAMKRLLNAYSIQRDIAILSGTDVLADTSLRKRLVLWTILRMRWPSLEPYLIQVATGRKHRQLDSETELLLQNSGIQDVINGKGIGVALDLKAVSELGNPFN